MYRLVLCLVFVASTLATPRPATAAVVEFYDTIDFAEVAQHNSNVSGSPPTLSLHGILAGGSTPVTRTYLFFPNSGTEGLEAAMHCHRLAVLVMSKPGKFQFAIHGSNFPTTAGGCRLTLVAP